MARLEALKSNKKRVLDEGVDSEEEEEAQREWEEGVEEEQVDPKEQRTIRILKAMKNGQHKVRGDIPMYDGSLKEEEILEWIASMDDYFECEEVPNEQRVRLAKTKLKGHALLWWNHEEAHRRRRCKPKIVFWDRMIEKMKGKFLLKYFDVY